MKALPFVLVSLVSLLLAACGTQRPVPVAERSPTTTEKPLRPMAPATPVAVAGAYYTVKKGDTLFSIALDQGHDYKDIVAWNNLDNPNLIRVGQQLRMSPPGSSVDPGVAVVKPISGPAPVEVKPVAAKPLAPATEANTESLKREPKGGKVPFSEAALVKARESMPTKTVEAAPEPRPVEAAKAPATEPAAAPVAAVADGAIDWSWPIDGRLISPFSEGSNKGIDIVGKSGDPVHATAAGKVVYAGSGLRGYGKLVIVRHNADYLSAYAHNSQILVKEGQAVTRRQVIAEVGSTDAESPRLHFEIRRQGKPADPLKFLPAR